MTISERLGRFGHSPADDPANDFCIEVEAIEGEIANTEAGLDGCLSWQDIDDRIFKAMTFTVGGDAIAIAAKGTLRELERKVKAKLRPAMTIDPKVLEEIEGAANAVAKSNNEVCFHRNNGGTVPLDDVDALTDAIDALHLPLSRLIAALRTPAPAPVAGLSVEAVERVLREELFVGWSRDGVNNDVDAPSVYGIPEAARAIAALTPAAPATTGALRSGEERIGRHEDIILEALNTYDQFMRDDDFDAWGALRAIVTRMHERLGRPGALPLTKPEAGDA